MRHRVRFFLRGLALGVLVAFPVAADQPGAPPGQYATYDSGSTRIHDVKTHLVWERFIATTTVQFSSARCAPPTRLPTLKELLTLVDEQPHLDYDISTLRNVQKMIDPSAFGKSTPVNAPYWTSSVEGSRVWTVDFETGATNTESNTAYAYYRCVTVVP